MPQEDPLNSCLLAVRTLEVRVENFVDRIARHDRDITDIKEDVGDIRQDVAIVRNEVEGLVKIKNYLVLACIGQILAMIFLIPTLIVQTQHLTDRSTQYSPKTAK